VLSTGVPSPPGFTSPPSQLVEDGRQHLGRFDGPVGRANLIDARLGAWPRPLRRVRLKEWQALQISTPSLFCNLALFDAKLMSLLQVKVYERERDEKHVREVKLRPGQLRIADNLLDSTNRHAGRRGMLAFDNRMKDGRIDVEFETRGLAGKLVVHTARGASQVVSLPFSGDTGMYSHKGMFPIEGELTVGGARHVLTTADALALLDDHKGYYPYVMKWDWVTSATVDATGRAHGFNLTRNQCRDPEQFNENCAWIGAAIGRLPAVTFERVKPRQPGEHWLIRDAAGRVDVRFTPTVPGDVKINAVVVESRYRGPFGTFTGRVEPEGLDGFSVDGMFGMGEEFWLRC
jgi:hypothetical protein